MQLIPNNFEWDCNDTETTKAVLELQLYKFKTYIGSVSRAIQNKKLKDISYTGE